VSVTDIKFIIPEYSENEEKVLCELHTTKL